MVLWALASCWFGIAALRRLLAGTGTIAGSLFWVAAAVVCVLFTVRSVRRALGLSRGKTRRYISFTGEPTVAPRWARPLAALSGGLLLILLGLIFVLFASLSRTSAAESRYTQAHGVREHATVTEVHNERNCGPDSCSTSASIWVILDKPVAGRTDATVGVQGTVPYAKGQSIAVLVDPKDPAHAELPGRPSSPSGGGATWTVAIVVVLALGCALVIRTVWLRWRTGTWIAGWPFR